MPSGFLRTFHRRMSTADMTFQITAELLLNMARMDDFKEFLDGAHERGIRVVLDLVLNHTSDQHPWFMESRKDKTNPKRDWYIWKSTENGEPPTQLVFHFWRQCLGTWIRRPMSIITIIFLRNSLI